MKRPFRVLSVSGAIPLLMIVGCGGSTGALGAGADSGSGSTASGSGSTSAVTTGASSTDIDAGMAISPGLIGSLAGAGGSDAGVAVLADSGASQAVIDGCTALCTKETAAACPNAGTLASCLVGCRLLVASPNCTSQTQALFACVNTTTASCDASGNVVLDGCVAQQLASDGCFLTNATDPTLAAPCTTYCANVKAANCPNDKPSGCVSGCEVQGNLIPACAASWKAYVTCGDTSTFSCGTNGKAGADGCLGQALTFLGCELTGIASFVGDAGTD